MIIRIEASGSSFRGAGKYYLHDKASDASMAKELKPKTDERVWFTDTRNLVSFDPELALDEMWRTAEDQAYLKMAAAVARGGRVCSDPVKTLSLSWHKEDAPTPEHMIEAADAFLRHMRWHEHQAVYVGHSDTGHRHIHVILNRVHPDTGRTLDDFRERKRAQAWALEYEKEHDKLRCEQRELNAAHRERRQPELEASTPARQSPEPTPSPVPERQPANDHLPHNVIAITRPFERQFDAGEQERRLADEAHRLLLKTDQRAEREAFFEEGAKLFKATRHAIYDEVRKEFRDEWRDYYAKAKATELAIERHSESGIARALFFARDGDWDKARGAFRDRHAVERQLRAELQILKADIKSRQSKEIRTRQKDACDALRDIRDVQYRELLQRQREERAAFRAGEMLAEAGHARHDATPTELASANGNIAPSQQNEAPAHEAPAPLPRLTPEIAPQSSLEPVAVEATPPADRSHVPSLPEAPEPTRQLADLAAGAIGGAASYIADQLGELFSPTPPEVRDAIAKEQARAAEAKPAPEPKPDPYAKYVEAALKAAEADRQGRDADAAYWKERDRGKGWDRDR